MPNIPKRTKGSGSLGVDLWGRIQNMDRGPWTTSWTRSMDHHGPPHGPGPWTRSMDQVPWTTPNFLKEIALVNFIWKFTEGQGMKNKDSYYLHSWGFVSQKRLVLGSRPHEWEDHKLVLRYRRSSAFLPLIFSFQHFQIAIRSGRHLSPRQPPAY